jgi:hypothetical protein
VSGEFWAGLLALPALAAAVLVLWALYAFASQAWERLHVRLMERIAIAPNLNSVYPFTKAPPAPRPKYEDGANKIRDALLASPRFYSAHGLGWIVLLVRDSKRAPESDQ